MTEWSAFVNKIRNYEQEPRVVWSHFHIKKRERIIVQIEYLTILVRFFSCNPTFFHVGNKRGAAAGARWLVRSSPAKLCRGSDGPARWLWAAAAAATISQFCRLKFLQN